MAEGVDDGGASDPLSEAPANDDDAPPSDSARGRRIVLIVAGVAT